MDIKVIVRVYDLDGDELLSSSSLGTAILFARSGRRHTAADNRKGSSSFGMMAVVFWHKAKALRLTKSRLLCALYFVFMLQTEKDSMRPPPSVSPWSVTAAHWTIKTHHKIQQAIAWSYRAQWELQHWLLWLAVLVLLQQSRLGSERVHEKGMWASQLEALLTIHNSYKAINNFLIFILKITTQECIAF